MWCQWIRQRRLLLLLLAVVVAIAVEAAEAEADRATHPGPCCCWRGCCRTTHTLSILIPSVLPHMLTLWVRESRVLLPSQASKRRRDKKDNKLADDEEETMVAFLEANEMLWDKKATLYRRPDLKITAWQNQAETMGKSLTCKAGSRACVTTSLAWTSCPRPGMGSGFSHRGSCGRYRKWTSSKR